MATMKKQKGLGLGLEALLGPKVSDSPVGQTLHARQRPLNTAETPEER